MGSKSTKRFLDGNIKSVKFMLGIVVISMYYRRKINVSLHIQWSRIREQR